MDASKLANCELDGEYAVGCRISVSRNIAGFRLTPCIDRCERRMVQKAIVDAAMAMDSKVWCLAVYLYKALYNFIL